MEISYFSFKYAQNLLAMRQTTGKLVKGADIDIIMVFTIRMKNPLWWSGYLSTVLFRILPSDGL